MCCAIGMAIVNGVNCSGSVAVFEKSEVRSRGHYLVATFQQGRSKLGSLCQTIPAFT